MLKKIFIISILTIIGFSQVGYYITFRQQQSQQKKSVKYLILSQLKEEELTVISLTENLSKVFWEEEGKEFYYNDEMYDVVKTKTVKGEVLLYCINDKKEKELINKYNLITKHNSSSDKKSKHITDNTVKLFVYTTETDQIFFNFIAKQFHIFSVVAKEGIHRTITPPPKA